MESYDVKVFSKGKYKGNNEDYFGYASGSFVVADGATDKNGWRFNKKTAGQLVSRLVADSCLSSDLVGVDLVAYLNKTLAKLYHTIGISTLAQTPIHRLACSFIAVRLIQSKIAITVLGDLGYRLNGRAPIKYEKKVDILNSQKRSKYIAETEDVNGSRKHLMPWLKKQFEYQNNPIHELGYGVVDGTYTPDKFIHLVIFDRKDIHTIELFTDGYFDVPEKVGIDEWETMYQAVESIDPHKYKKYKSTKAKDDRTIMIITL